MEDYDIDDLYCPYCGHHTHSRRCYVPGCEGGYFDESDEDYLLPCTTMVPCDNCHGTGIERWCPGCGEDLSGHHFDDDD